MTLFVIFWMLFVAMIIGINVSRGARRGRARHRRGSYGQHGSTWDGGSSWSSSDGGSSWGSSDCGSSWSSSDGGSSSGGSSGSDSGSSCS